MVNWLLTFDTAVTECRETNFLVSIWTAWRWLKETELEICSAAIKTALSQRDFLHKKIILEGIINSDLMYSFLEVNRICRYLEESHNGEYWRYLLENIMLLSVWQFYSDDFTFQHDAWIIGSSIIVERIFAMAMKR